MISEEDIKNALKAVKYPGYSRDIVSFGLVKEVAAGNGAVSVIMNLTGGNAETARQILRILRIDFCDDPFTRAFLRDLV